LETIYICIIYWKIWMYSFNEFPYVFLSWVCRVSTFPFS
jgi:hypothetical protein